MNRRLLYFVFRFIVSRPIVSSHVYKLALPLEMSSRKTIHFASSPYQGLQMQYYHRVIIGRWEWQNYHII